MINDEVIAIIPARSGSKGIADKNLKELKGHSLLEWAIKAAIKSNEIDRVFVSTDSEYYAELAVSYGAEVPFLRPEEISGDDATDIEFLEHFLSMTSNLKINPSFLVHLRATSPTRISVVLDEAINTFRKNPECTSLRSIHKMSESAYKTFEVTEENLLVTTFERKSDIELSNKARQSFPKTYFANGYVDILRPELIIRDGLMHGNKVFAYQTSPIIEVDNWDDFNLLEAFLELPLSKEFLEIFQ